MSAIVLAAIGLVAFLLGYLFYSKFLATKIYQLDPDYATPSHTMEDGVDYVPTNKFVLWGHHFTSVAGAAPISFQVLLRHAGSAGAAHHLRRR